MSVLFVVLLILLGLAIVFTIAFPFTYRFVYQRKYHQIYGRKLYRLSMVKDYYLIHDLLLESHDNQFLHIDHLLFGNKYIYLFYDFYCDKELYGKSIDNSLLMKGKKTHSYTENPALIAKQQMKELSVLINFDESLFVPIAIVNDTCNIINYDDSKSLVYLRKVKQVVKYYEDKNVDPLNQEQMLFAVKDIARINLRDKKKK